MRRDRRELIKKLNWFADMHRAEDEQDNGFDGTIERAEEEETCLLRFAQTYGYDSWIDMIIDHENKFNKRFVKVDRND